jgi:peptidase M15-like protein
LGTPHRHRRVRAVWLLSSPRLHRERVVRSTTSALVCGLALLMMAGARAEKFDTKTASFAIAFHDNASSYRDSALFVLPEDKVALDAVGGPPGDYTLTTDAGIAEQLGVRRWRWTAPRRSGVYALKVEGPGARHDTITVRAFVLVPFSDVKNGWLNGYRIGEYPPPLKGNPLYLPPRGFVEVTKENADTKLSPHFTLEQFICKGDTTKTYPKYLIVQERLLLKLEAILERVNALGFHVDTLHVMSAYRTPYYNHAIGDGKYSMHQFGSAADVYVDPENTDRMADLNHDRVIDVNDSKFLYDRVDELLAKPEYARFQGGLGFYPATSAHPPFVHVDVRGTKARWKG